jgi:hypothetical protein
VVPSRQSMHSAGPHHHVRHDAADAG